MKERPTKGDRSQEGNNVPFVVVEEVPHRRKLKTCPAEAAHLHGPTGHTYRFAMEAWSTDGVSHVSGSRQRASLHCSGLQHTQFSS